MPDSIPYGQRLKAPTDKRMFRRFPGSEDIRTLPAGKPSPVVDSYVLQGGGYYALKTDGGEMLYLADTSDLEIVPPDAPDQSGALSSVYNWAADMVENAVKDVERNAGYVSDGFETATAGFGTGFTDFTKDIRTFLLIGAGLLVLVVVGIIISKFN